MSSVMSSYCTTSSCIDYFLTIPQYRKFRDNHPDGYLKHLFYHWGLYFCKSKSMRNPFIKQYIP